MAEASRTSEESTGGRDPVRLVVWCRPHEWPACVSGEGCLNTDVMVEKKAAEDKLQELVASKGWTPQATPVPDLLGVPMLVWMAPAGSPGQLEEGPVNAAALRLLSDPQTGGTALQPRGMVLITHKDPSKDLTPQMVRNVLLWMEDLRSICWQPSTAAPVTLGEVETAAESWPAYVRRLTEHLQAKMLPMDHVPPMPKLLSDFTLGTQEA